MVTTLELERLDRDLFRGINTVMAQTRDIAVRRAGGGAGAAGGGAHRARRSRPALAARLLPPSRSDRQARRPASRPRPRRRVVLGPSRLCDPGWRGHLLDAGVLPQPRRRNDLRRRRRHRCAAARRMPAVPGGHARGDPASDAHRGRRRSSAVLGFAYGSASRTASRPTRLSTPARSRTSPTWAPDLAVCSSRASATAGPASITRSGSMSRSRPTTGCCSSSGRGRRSRAAACTAARSRDQSGRLGGTLAQEHLLAAVARP